MTFRSTGRESPGGFPPGPLDQLGTAVDAGPHVVSSAGSWIRLALARENRCHAGGFATIAPASRSCPSHCFNTYGAENAFSIGIC